MTSSIILAKILGPYCAIVGIGILLNLKNCQKIVMDYTKSPALIYLGGILALFFGLIILVFHNIWASNWTSLITLFGWLGLLKGLVLIVFPNKIEKLVARYQKSTTLIMIQSICIILIGIFLTLKGYCGN